MRKVFILILLITITIGAKTQEKKEKLTLEDIFTHYRFYPYFSNEFESMKDGEHFTNIDMGMNIHKYSFKTGKKTSTLFSIVELEEKPGFIDSYTLNEEETKILLEFNRENIYRHSFKSDYYLYTIATKKITKVFDEGKIQLATLSPDGNNIAFVYENNLYIKSLIHDSIHQITNDGKKNYIINGLPDWVYEEEFSFNKAFTWSPDSKTLAYIKFDESKVRQFSMMIYDSLYPTTYKFKYPKTGERNSIVSVHSYHLDTKNTVTIASGNDTDIYITRIKWTQDKNTLCVIHLNRLQNHVKVLLANVLNGKTTILYEEKEEQYISEITDDYITFTDDGEYFLIKSERDGYIHLYRYTMSGKLMNQITHGIWDVDEVLGIDNNETLYYTAFDNSPLRIAVYSIKLDGTEKTTISQQQGSNTAFFSKGFKYYIHQHSTANNPGNVTLYNKNHEKIRVIEEHKDVKEAMKKYGFTPKEFFTFTTSENIELNGFMIKPPNFNKKKKYPLFMYVYGGPEYRTVIDDIGWNDAWFQFLAQKGYIVACIDGRGSGGRGEEFRKCIYMNLGKLETIDQIEAAKYLSKQSYIDENRIGIFGWSYGGYLTLLCLTKAANMFKMGIAVAPITNWRFYDSIYTERYMRTPQENPRGYDDNSPINFVENLKDKLLLIHGMADDNVHLQNSTELVKHLVEADKQFEMQFYPNKNHGIYGGNTTLHLYKRMSEFILENL